MDRAPADLGGPDPALPWLALLALSTLAGLCLLGCAKEKERERSAKTLKSCNVPARRGGPQPAKGRQQEDKSGLDGDKKQEGSAAGHHKQATPSANGKDRKEERRSEHKAENGKEARSRPEGKEANAKTAGGSQGARKAAEAKADSGGKPDEKDKKEEGPPNDDEKPPDVCDPTKVQMLGLLDDKMNNENEKRKLEMNNIPSQHEFSKKEPKTAPEGTHAVINEKLCQLYETDQVDTVDDENEVQANEL